MTKRQKRMKKTQCFCLSLPLSLSFFSRACLTFCYVFHFLVLFSILFLFTSPIGDHHRVPFAFISILFIVFSPTFREKTRDRQRNRQREIEFQCTSHHFLRHHHFSQKQKKGKLTSISHKQVFCSSEQNSIGKVKDERCKDTEFRSSND